MTDFEVHATLVKRFFGKLPIATWSNLARSTKPNYVEVGLPRSMTMSFQYESNKDIEVYLYFEDGISVFWGEDNLFDLVSTEFYETEVEHCPFKEFSFDWVTDSTDNCHHFYLKGVIRRDELTEDKLSEYVSYVLHPSPFFKKLLKLADGNTEDYDDQIVEYYDDCDEYYEEDDDEQPDDSDDD